MKHPFILALVSASLPAFAAQYKIDASHSTVGFKVKHLAISTVRGNFGAFEGTLDFDPAKPNDLKTEATIETKSIDTNDAKRDQHLRGDDFFAADKNPKITFKSTKADLNKNGKGKLAGDLTMRGVTKSVVLDVELLGTGNDPWGNTKASFSGTTRVNRKDFGINWNQALDAGGVVVSDEVDIQLDIEANLVKAEKKADEKKAEEKKPAKK